MRLLEFITETVLSAALMCLLLAVLHSCTAPADAHPQQPRSTKSTAANVAPADDFDTLWANDPYRAAEAAIVYEP